MKLMIASDLHGSAYYCRALLESFRREEADRLVLLEDWQGAAAAIRAAYAGWTERQTYLHCVTGHDAVDDAEAMYHRALAFTEREEDSELRAELADLRDQLRLLAEMEEFSLRNVL